MSERKKREEKRRRGEDPINFTCGKCHQVHPFDSEDPYACTLEEED